MSWIQTLERHAAVGFFGLPIRNQNCCQGDDVRINQTKLLLIATIVAIANISRSEDAVDTDEMRIMRPRLWVVTEVTYEDKDLEGAAESESGAFC